MSETQNGLIVDGVSGADQNEKSPSTSTSGKTSSRKTSTPAKKTQPSARTRAKTTPSKGTATEKDASPRKNTASLSDTDTASAAAGPAEKAAKKSAAQSRTQSDTSATKDIATPPKKTAANRARTTKNTTPQVTKVPGTKKTTAAGGVNKPDITTASDQEQPPEGSPQPKRQQSATGAKSKKTAAKEHAATTVADTVPATNESVTDTPSPGAPKKSKTSKSGVSKKAGSTVIAEEATKPVSETSAPKSPKQSSRGSKKKQPQDATPVDTVAAEPAKAPSAPADTIEETVDATPKSRRGRRGGRGRGRKKNGVATSTTTNSEKETVTPATRVSKSTEEESVKSAKRRMFFSVVPSEQVEVVLEEDGSIHEYYLEMLHQAKTKGNIYKGVIHNVDTNLQAAFVNYGANKNGFLQIDEVHPEYYLTHYEPTKGKKFPPIQKVLRPGQEVLVQVVKEPTGNKGAFLTTWVSLAGRFLVLTPGQEQIGVSRKVDNDEERNRLKELMNGIDPGDGLGVIVRTVSAGMAKTTLKNDLQYLKRAWKEIRKKATTEPTPSLIHKESDLAQRAVRDYLTEDVTEVWVDDEATADRLRETISLLFPRKKSLVRMHSNDQQTLWERFKIQRQLEQIYSREVLLPSGGRLVFDQTEALMAIDINSGKISGKTNFETMALKTNVEAAQVIARHLRLRDIGGQIVIDFIEMRDKKHIREVEKTIRNAMKNDRARHDIGRISAFGLLEIVRQRTGSSALAITMEPCPVCEGTGIRRNLEWRALQALREIQRLARNTNQDACVYNTTPELGLYLLNHKRERLQALEQQHSVSIKVNLTT